MQAITRAEIWRIGQIYLRREATPAAIRWVCDSRPRAQWLSEMLWPHRPSPDSPTYMVNP